MGVGVHEEDITLPHTMQQSHALRCSRGLVQERGRRDGQGGQVLHHGLEGEQRLQSTLADLRLVRRVCGVPRRTLYDIAPDDRGSVTVLISHADHGRERAVGRGEIRHRLRHGWLIHGLGHGQSGTPADRFGDDVVKEGTHG